MAIENDSAASEDGDRNPNKDGSAQMPPTSTDSAEAGSVEAIPAKRAIRRQVKAARKYLKKSRTFVLPAVDADSIGADARHAVRSGNENAAIGRAVQYVRSLCDHALAGERPNATALLAGLEASLRDLTSVAAQTRRAIDHGPQLVDVAGERQPWTFRYAAHVVILLCVAVFACCLGWRSIGFIVGNSGIFSPDQAWIVCAGSIFAVVALEARALTLTAAARKLYAKALLTGAIGVFAAWLVPFVYVFGLPLYRPVNAIAQSAGAAAGSEDSLLPFMGMAQLLLQLAGEILAVAGAVVSVHTICDAHSGLKSVVHPDRRRREKLLAGLLQLSAQVQESIGGLRARLAALDGAVTARAIETERAVERRIRMLRTELADLYGERSYTPDEEDQDRDDDNNAGGTGVRQMPPRNPTGGAAAEEAA
ncbi:MAG TPA: hypothetical protein VF669_17890 [Tepidisphaeraceae bacterium]|jgi:hypothetical protein